MDGPKAPGTTLKDVDFRGCEGGGAPSGLYVSLLGQGKQVGAMLSRGLRN